MLKEWLALWPVAFAVTLAVEVPIYTLLAPRETKRWQAALAGAACSCVTHPLLWFVWMRSITGYVLAVSTGEVLVVLVETGVFWLLTGRRSLGLAAAAALLANGTSFGVGVIVFFYT